MQYLHFRQCLSTSSLFFSLSPSLNYYLSTTFFSPVFTGLSFCRSILHLHKTFSYSFPFPSRLNGWSPATFTKSFIASCRGFSLCGRWNNMERRKTNCRKLAAITSAGVGQDRPLIKGLGSQLSTGTFGLRAHYR